MSQTFKEFEYIIIDGNSNDKTLEIIDEFSDQISTVISEADRGIYDAMNKGINLASGEWIYFLNVGDKLYDQYVFENLFKGVLDADLIYGNHESDYGYFRRIHRPLTLKEIKWGMIFSHQAAIVKTKLMKETRFDISNRFSADYNFIYKLYKNGGKFQYINLVFASLEAGGTSELNITRTHNERWKISRAYASYPSKIAHDFKYFVILCSLYFKKAVKFVLPKRYVHKLTVRKYKT